MRRFLNCLQPTLGYYLVPCRCELNEHAGQYREGEVFTFLMAPKINEVVEIHRYATKYEIDVETGKLQAFVNDEIDHLYLCIIA